MPKKGKINKKTLKALYEELNKFDCEPNLILSIDPNSYPNIIFYEVKNNAKRKKSRPKSGA